MRGVTSSHRTGIPRNARAAAVTDLAGLALAAQRDSLFPDAYGASVERQDTPASQDKSHDWPQEISREILICERWRTGAQTRFVAPSTKNSASLRRPARKILRLRMK